MTLARRTHSKISAEDEKRIIRQAKEEVRRELRAADSYEDWADEQDASELELDDIRRMTPAQITEHQEAVDRVLAGTARTGQQLVSESAPGPAPLSFESLKRMSVSEYEARRDEIDRWLAAHGGAR